MSFTPLLSLGRVVRAPIVQNMFSSDALRFAIERVSVCLFVTHLTHLTLGDDVQQKKKDKMLARITLFLHESRASACAAQARGEFSLSITGRTGSHGGKTLLPSNRTSGGGETGGKAEGSRQARPTPGLA